MQLIGWGPSQGAAFMQFYFIFKVTREFTVRNNMQSQSLTKTGASVRSQSVPRAAPTGVATVCVGTVMVTPTVIKVTLVLICQTGTTCYNGIM